MNRNLDGIYYRVERNGKWENHCFTDLTLEEIDKLTSEYNEKQWKQVALHLRERIIDMAEQLDIVGKEED